MRPNPSAAGLALAFLLVSAARATAAPPDLQVVLPTLTTTPGGTVNVPINVSLDPARFGIESVDFRLTLDPAVIQTSQSLADGFLQTWGPPFVNATSSFLAAAAAGATPVTTTSVLVNTVQLTVKAGVAPGTNMTLSFQHLTFNGGSPSVGVTNGVLQVRSATAVPDGGPPGFSLSPLAPNPASGSARLAFALPASGNARAELAIFALDGRRVRTLVDGALSAGAHESVWDLHDASGRPVAAGLYFARLTDGGRHIERCLVVVR